VRCTFERRPVRLVELLRDGDLLTNGASSLYRASAGLRCDRGRAALGVFMAWWRPVNAVLAAGRAVLSDAEIALIPVTVLWLGFGDGSKFC